MPAARMDRAIKIRLRRNHDAFHFAAVQRVESVNQRNGLRVRFHEIQGPATQGVGVLLYGAVEPEIEGNFQDLARKPYSEGLFHRPNRMICRWSGSKTSPVGRMMKLTLVAISSACQ